MSDSKEDFYEPALCPKCNSHLEVTRSREEWGIETYLTCNKCDHDECNLTRRY